MAEMQCSQPGCDEKKSRINGYCSVYCKEVDEARQDVNELRQAIIDWAQAEGNLNLAYKYVPVRWGDAENVDVRLEPKLTVRKGGYMSDQPKMTMDEVRKFLSECWVDGENPQPGTVHPFCRWCHYARPKHDPESLCVALQSALVGWQEAERLILNAERAIVYAATVLQPKDGEDFPGRTALAGLNAQILALAPVVVRNFAILPPKEPK